ncbi:MAG TPA: hypothetical protein VKV40_01385 [Ktedonobacteraceae bacterium]|nr:hypothetical protein [Ktedonobacteraceae bacterium]
MISPIYQGDTGSPFAPTLLDDSGASLINDLSNSAISMKWQNRLTGVVQICAGGWAIDNRATGACHYNLTTSDVATVGQFTVYITVQTAAGPRHLDPFDIEIIPVI